MGIILVLGICNWKSGLINKLFVLIGYRNNPNYKFLIPSVNNILPWLAYKCQNQGNNCQHCQYMYPITLVGPNKNAQHPANNQQYCGKK